MATESQFSLYDATMPQYLRILPGMFDVVDKVEAWATASGTAPAEALNRSIPGSGPLTLEVRRTLYYSSGAVRGMLNNRFGLDPNPPPQDFAALRGKVTKAYSLLQPITRERVNGKAAEGVHFPYSETNSAHFTGAEFLLSYAQPMFFYAVTTVHLILRQIGIATDCYDFLGAVNHRPAAMV